MNNPHLFKDKVVMDLGCGTGILSVFAVRAGAKHVIAIDQSDIALWAQKIVKNNGLEDKITVIKEKIENLTSLPHGFKKVDVIISEWMGYFLLYESMLDSVLLARDKWLAPEGILMPDTAKMYVCLLEDQQFYNSKMKFWNNVYDIDMSLIRPFVISDPMVDKVDFESVMSDPCQIFEIDIKTCKASELDFVSSYKFTSYRQDYVHAVIGWFDVVFKACHVPITLSTSPKGCYTHWKQTIFYFDQPYTVFKGDEISGTISVKKNDKKARDLDVKISHHLNNKYHHNVSKAINYRIR